MTTCNVMRTILPDRDVLTQLTNVIIENMKKGKFVFDASDEQMLNFS